MTTSEHERVRLLLRTRQVREFTDEPLTGAVADEAFQTLRHAFDPRWGGFGGAPKFPQPMTLEFVLRQAIRDVPDALEMVVLTLDRMAGGGMFDQVGGGFARYSTDGAWGDRKSVV